MLLRKSRGRESMFIDGTIFVEKSLHVSGPM